MGTIILLVILGIAIIIALIMARNFGRTAKKLDKSDSDFDYGTAVWGKRIGLIISGVLTLIVGGIFAFGSFYSQGEGVSTVQVSFAGNVVATTTDAGLKFKAPWNSIQEFNISNQTVEIQQRRRRGQGWCCHLCTAGRWRKRQCEHQHHVLD